MPFDTAATAPFMLPKLRESLRSLGSIRRSQLAQPAHRSSIGGWVENRDAIPPPLNGFTMNSGSAAWFTCMGIACAPACRRSSASASAFALPEMRAPVASAAYSRCREIASWMIVAAIGARNIIASAPTSPSGLSSSPPMNSSM